MSFEHQDNLSVRVSDWIAQKIITGEYAPGARIREEHIAATLNTSRGPIREALLILQRQRLVDILPRRGAVVTALSEQQVIELYDVIAALYTLLAVNVTHNWQDQQLQPLDTLLKQMEHEYKAAHAERYFELSVEFYERAQPIAHNTLLANLIKDLVPSVNRIQYVSIQYRQHDLKHNWENLSAILDCVRQRNISNLIEVIALHHDQEKAFAILALKFLLNDQLGKTA